MTREIVRLVLELGGAQKTQARRDVVPGQSRIQVPNIYGMHTRDCFDLCLVRHYQLSSVVTDRPLEKSATVKISMDEVCSFFEKALFYICSTGVCRVLRKG